MFKLSVVLPLLIGLAFYVYIAWVAPDVEPRSVRYMGSLAALMFALAGASVAYACFWGAAHGFSPYQILLGELPPEKFGNFAYAARTMVILAGLCSVHALLAFLLRRKGMAGNGS